MKIVVPMKVIPSQSPKFGPSTYILHIGSNGTVFNFSIYVFVF